MEINVVTLMLASVLELASIFSIVTLGLVFSFRMVGFADLTIESSFTTGAAICAIILSKTSLSPVIGLIMGGLVGTVVGLCTALLHVKGKISRLLSGIIMMTVLYSVNLQIMGRSNIQLVDSTSIFNNIPKGLSVIILLLIAFFLYIGSKLLLKTHFGYLLRACGENAGVVEKLGYNSGFLVICALMISNCLTSFSGALAAQYFGYADIGMGTGLIVTSLAALILGEAICSPKTLLRLLVAAFIGTVLYRLAFEIGLRMNIHPWNLRIAVGVLLAVSLVVKQILSKKRGVLLVGVEGL